MCWLDTCPVLDSSRHPHRPVSLPGCPSTTTLALDSGRHQHKSKSPPCCQHGTAMHASSLIQPAVLQAQFSQRTARPGQTEEAPQGCGVPIENRDLLSLAHARSAAGPSFTAHCRDRPGHGGTSGLWSPRGRTTPSARGLKQSCQACCMVAQARRAADPSFTAHCQAKPG